MRTVFLMEPRPEIDISTTSPSLRYSWRGWFMATPDGVPVDMMSPFSSVIDRLSRDTMSKGLMCMPPASASCLTSPLTRVVRRSLSGSPASSAVVIQGPHGANVSNPLARVNWPSAACMSRAETSLRIVYPNTASRASPGETSLQSRPTTIASSTS